MSVFFKVVSKKYNPPKDIRGDFTGRNVIVTGANVGLGLEASVKFVESGAKRVILAVRNLQKGEDAKAEIERRTARKGVVDVWQLDMLDYNSINKFADRANKDLDHLDIAVLNAGVLFRVFGQSKYGLETTLQVNVVSTVYLALLLLPKLKANKTEQYTPVLEIVDSGTHLRAKLKSEVENDGADPLEAYNTANGFNGQSQYGLSKLFLMYAVERLAKLADAKDGRHPIHVVAVCPGMTASDLGRTYSGVVMDLLLPVFKTVAMRTTEQGARTYISGILEGERAHGEFWSDDEVKPPIALRSGEKGERLQEQTWTSIVKALERNIPEVKQLLQ